VGSEKGDMTKKAIPFVKQGKWGGGKNRVKHAVLSGARNEGRVHSKEKSASKKNHPSVKE